MYGHAHDVSTALPSTGIRLRRGLLLAIYPQERAYDARGLEAATPGERRLRGMPPYPSHACSRGAQERFLSPLCCPSPCPGGTRGTTHVWVHQRTVRGVVEATGYSPSRPRPRSPLRLSNVFSATKVSLADERVWLAAFPPLGGATRTRQPSSPRCTLCFCSASFALTLAAACGPDWAGGRHGPVSDELLPRR